MLTKECRTCKIDFDEKYVNCSSCRKKRTDYMNSYYTPKIPKSYTKDCKLCGETFTTGNVRNSHEFKYCNDCNYKTAHSRSEKGKAANKAWHLKNYSPVKPKEIECFTCKITFSNATNRAKYCNPQCYPAKVKARELREKQRREGKDCQWCGKHISFENATDKELQFFKNKKFCSDKCTNTYRLSKPQNKLAARYRSEMWRILKDLNEDKAKPTFDILGYSYTELTHHIEEGFTKSKWYGYEWVEDTNKYSWENIGKWHIDHIRPVASFNFTTTESEDFKKCWALSNLQPLWATDNMSKGDKWDGVINA